MTHKIWSISSQERETILASLTGKVSDQIRPKAITKPGGGGKFTPDGAALFYPGNTFICHLDPTSTFFAAVCELQERLRASQFARYFTFLPRNSFHMTIFCGVSGLTLDSEGWPQDVPPQVGLGEITRVFCDKIADIACPPKFSVRPRSLHPNTISMCAVNDTEEVSLRTLRDQLRMATGLNRDDHETYEFHVSMAYLLSWMPFEEAAQLIALSEQNFAELLTCFGQVELGPLEFCTFDTMHHFKPIKTFI